MKARAVRITAVPRTGHPNSGLQAMHFASRYDDEVWAIPAAGSYLGDNPRVRFFTFDTRAAKRLLPVRAVRLAFLISCLFGIIFRWSRFYFVHSFVFAIPPYLLRRRYCIFIHGSDRRFLDTRWGRAVARRATDVFGVGFGSADPDLSVTEVPNIFIPADSVPVADIEHDVLFVLRNAPVKNPLYPIDLADNLGRRLDLGIVVAGIGASDLPPEQQQQLRDLQQSGCRIRYIGRKPYEDVVQLMRASRTLIIPSLAEGVPKVLLEAMSLGLHVAVNESLVLPADLSPWVDRVDLHDWPAVAEMIERERGSNRSAERAGFARQYLLDSQHSLLSLYDAIYKRQLGFVPSRLDLASA